MYKNRSPCDETMKCSCYCKNRQKRKKASLPSSSPFDISEAELLSDLVRVVPRPEPDFGDFPRDGDKDPDLVEGEHGLFKALFVPFAGGNCLVLASLPAPAVTLLVLLPDGLAVGRATGFGGDFALVSCPLAALPAPPVLFRVCLVPQPAIFSGFIHSSYLQ